jgi:GrpB-like predicted nucleotidyltransferase (UPF0157 family)/ribosomal protein S18 acetylase RimI-like enzyme
MARVEIHPWNPQWAKDFVTLKNRLGTILTTLQVTIEHVGSTSVEGLSAKPIIDIDILVSDTLSLQSVIAKLTAAGFEHRGNLGISGREAFRAPADFGPRANIYAGIAGIVSFRNHLVIRDALRNSPELRIAYGKIKSDIAAAVGEDVGEYTRRKSEFLCNILAESKCFSVSEILAVQVANRHDTLVRPVSVGDEIGAASVHIHSWRETYAGVIDDAALDALPIKFVERVERWRKIVNESSSASDKKTIVAVRDGDIVGFASVGVDRDGIFEGAGELWSLYLLRACQRKQIGYLLLCEGMKFLRENGYRSAYAWVLAGNPTMAFYRRSGAVDTGKRKTVEIGRKQYEEHAMRWDSLDQFV